ncbi:MAG TPA: hypothetical protein DCM05_00135 [Elusimicrobia bacterium]|nr:hypothetical protein [Elusimicrobiota bacterium]
MPACSAALLGEAAFALLDTETTGFGPERGARICEIAVLVVRGGKVLDSFASLVNPGGPIDPGAQHVHGITDAMVADSPSFKDVAAKVAEMLEGRVLVCHNAPFDLPFLEWEFRRAGRPLPQVPVVCTLKLARRHFGFASNRLGSIAEAIGAEARGLHRAGADTEILRQVFAHMVKELVLRKDVRTLDDLLKL